MCFVAYQQNREKTSNLNTLFFLTVVSLRLCESRQRLKYVVRLYNIMVTKKIQTWGDSESGVGIKGRI